MSSDPTLRALVEAEQRASETIANAEAVRATKAQQAEAHADKLYQNLKAQRDKIFEAEVQQSRSNGDVEVEQKIKSIEAEKIEEQAKYDQHQQSVVDLLLHHVTTCAITVDEQQKQAFLAIQRAKQARAAGVSDY